MVSLTQFCKLEKVTVDGGALVELVVLGEEVVDEDTVDEVVDIVKEGSRKQKKTLVLMWL